MPLSQQRCVEVAAPYRLRLIDYKSPFTNLFCHIMQLYICKKSRQTLLPGLKLFYGHPAFSRGGFFHAENKNMNNL